jgi:hypothetical protein
MQSPAMIRVDARLPDDVGACNDFVRSYGDTGTDDGIRLPMPDLNREVTKVLNPTIGLIHTWIRSERGRHSSGTPDPSAASVFD